MLPVWSLRCINKYLRSMGVGVLSRSKFLFVILGVIVTGFCFLGLRLSEIIQLQKRQLSIQATSHVQRVPVNLGEKKSSTNHLTYWLIAKNAESPHMQHVRNVFRMCGYDRLDKVSSSWDVVWSYEYPFPSKIKPEDIKPNQLINHFPGSGYLTSKVFLVKSKLSYIPTAFELPKDKDQFTKFAKANPEKLWVQKSNNHRGITIKSVDGLDLSASNTFVQEFVSDPFLIDNRKFDIGIYTVITSIDPLRVYVYDGEWLIRFCPEDYAPLDVKNPRKYVVEDDYTPTWEMPSLRDYYVRLKLSHRESILAYVRSQNLDADSLPRRIYDAVGDMILEKQTHFIKSLEKYPYGSSTFFEMVRFDFVLDSKLNIYLMEVNMSPNLSSAHFSANALLYEQVLLNTFSVAGITSKLLQVHESVQPDILVSVKDIQVYEKECSQCASCATQLCKLCVPCLTPTMKTNLERAYREHTNRMQCARAFPKPVSELGKGTKENTNNHLTENDKLMELWFTGMCRKSSAWCQ
uniref:Probable beta-tubulin polyglutamylase n=1 Tax=Phallusia mammillata TaxID=59560 RepID=A0A6F9DV76_9ASCI|nr:probable beta-tubulin polyglutamylase [Phallusia mammillata]